MKTWAGLLLGLVLAAQPFVVWLAAYHSRDCDDKANHFFSAMYARAPSGRRAALVEVIAPFVRAHEHDPAWWRTAFRLSQTGTYPLPNLTIALFHRPGRHFSLSVRDGLLAVAIAAELAVIALAGLTTFGPWATLLVLELIAFHAVPSAPFIADIPRNMHPFAWHAPRAAAALLVVPAVVSLAARRPVAALVSLVICALLHVWLGALCAALLGVAVAAEWVVTRYDLLRRPYPYVLLGLGLFGGRELVTTVIVAATVLFWCRAPDESLERRGLVLTAILLVVCAAAVAVFASEPVVRTLEAAVGFPVVREIPARLSGVRYSLVTLGAVLAGRRLAATWSRTRALVFPATLVLLVVVPLLHPEPYQRVAARQSGFFGKNCPEAHAIPLPAGVMSLSLADEPTLFLSLAEYVAGD